MSELGEEGVGRASSPRYLRQRQEEGFGPEERTRNLSTERGMGTEESLDFGFW